MIRKAKIKDLTEILPIIFQVKKLMLEKGNSQWDSEYPGEKEYRKDIRRKELYVEEENGMIVGWMTINDCFPKEYEGVSWNTSTPANTIHRLAVNPNHKGKGVANRLFAFAEQLSKQQGKRSIRLDTFLLNKIAQRLFLHNGYQKAGQIYMKGKSIPYICYEKELK